MENNKTGVAFSYLIARRLLKLCGSEYIGGSTDKKALGTRTFCYFGLKCGY